MSGGATARSVPAGLVFAVLLVLMALAVRRRGGPGWGTTWRWLGRRDRRGVVRDGTLATLGVAVLCAGPLLVHTLAPGGSLDVTGFPVWAGVVTAVAVGEEMFLRGALWQALSGWRGETVALVATTVAFALLHVPFYGTGVVPLDLAVGLLLGGLRQVTGGVAAPAATHVAADIAGWWLR
jgi:membrane protease YdiL (CAAX protease family)